MSLPTSSPALGELRPDAGVSRSSPVDGPDPVDPSAAERGDVDPSPRAAFSEESSALADSQPERGSRLRDRVALGIGLVAMLPTAILAGWITWTAGPSWPLVLVALGAMGLSWILAHYIAQRVTRGTSEGMARLSEHCCAIDADWRYGDSQMPSGPDAPAEMHLLLRNFDRMARRVDRSFGRLRTALDEAGALQERLGKVVESREDEIRARTVELQVANLNLERLARQDGLTGIANHRRFVEFADQVWRLCMREERPVAIVMIDVDHFKAFNDIYGHQAGDQCLCKVSKAIASIARRPLDLAARYGGEEFAVILSHTDREDALSLAEQARRAVMALEIPHAGSKEYGLVTISLGVASLAPQRDTEVTTLISVADRALYRAKRGGRNRSEA